MEGAIRLRIKERGALESSLSLKAAPLPNKKRPRASRSPCNIGGGYDTQLVTKNLENSEIQNKIRGSCELLGSEKVSVAYHLRQSGLITSKP